MTPKAPLSKTKHYHAPRPNALGGSPLQQRIIGSLLLLCLGLGLLADCYFEPLHWAEMHPGQTVTISTQFLITGAAIALMGIALAFGAKLDKRLTTILFCVGVVIGILVRMALVSALTDIAPAH